jgi:hypothetical protein
MDYWLSFSKPLDQPLMNRLARSNKQAANAAPPATKGVAVLFRPDSLTGRSTFGEARVTLA